jgi:hypothetical protein
VVENNALGDNGNAGIEVKDDNRGSVKNVTIGENQVNGDSVRGCDTDGARCT